jgi:chaperone modulatory protein CbpM
MLTVDAVAAQLSLEREEIVLWIEREWVRPKRDTGEPLFDATDLARARLIHELAHELSIDADAMPVILSLLDQVYALRGLVKEIADAVATLPEPQRSSILERIRAFGEDAP